MSDSTIVVIGYGGWDVRPPPTAAYDIPLWCAPKVGRGQHAQVARGLYSLPTQYVGHTLRARADATTVRFYAGAFLSSRLKLELLDYRSADKWGAALL